jgi:hypothetical protein
VGYASASDLRVHFGLADDRKVSLEIHWPSGIRQEMKDVPADQRLTIREPNSPVRGTSNQEKRLRP